MGLVETFYSIQGEGANAGRAAYFIRFAGCNLDCHFADGSVCDTPWQKAQEKLTLRQLDERMEEELTDSCWNACPMVILTGGEPTLAPVFNDLVSLLHARGLYVAVETNGTTWRAGLGDCDWVVCSPKDAIQHGNPLGSPSVNAAVITAAHEFRYVISGYDSPEPACIPGKYNCLSPALMADGRGLEYTEKAPPAFAHGAVERCIQLIKDNPRWRLSLQTHKWLKVR